MNNKDLRQLQEAVEKSINPKLQELNKFIEREKSLGDPDQFEIFDTEVNYFGTHRNRTTYTVSFKDRGDYYEAEYVFTWYTHGDYPDHSTELLSLTRYTNEGYNEIEQEVPKGSPLFLDAEEKIDYLVYNDKIGPNVPDYYYPPEDY